MRVQVNGRDLAATARFATREITQSAPRQKDAAEDYVHVALADPALVIAGANVIVVSVGGSTPATAVTDLELRYDYQYDYEKLWGREPVKLNETPTPRR